MWNQNNTQNWHLDTQSMQFFHSLDLSLVCTAYSWSFAMSFSHVSSLNDEIRNTVHTTSFMSCHHAHKCRDNLRELHVAQLPRHSKLASLKIYPNKAKHIDSPWRLKDFGHISGARARKSWKSKLKLSWLENQRNVTNRLKTKLKQANFILWSKFTFVLSCTTTICSQCFASSFHRTKRSARAQFYYHFMPLTWTLTVQV